MRYLIGLTAALALLGSCCARHPHDAGDYPAYFGHLVAWEYIQREEIMMYEVGDVAAPHYAEAATAYGALRFAEIHHEFDLADAVTARYERILDEGLPNTANHVDANVIGLWPIEIYQSAGRDDWLEEGLALADAQWAETGDDGLTTQARYWIDDVWMIGILQARAYRATFDETYADRAAAMAVAYLDRLQQPNGLFHHGPDAPFYWGRGNGWVAAGLVEILDILPTDHPDSERIIQGYTMMMDALLEHQAESGMWRQLIDDPEAWEESSGTAMFGYALMAGYNAGILKDEAYRDAADRAWHALAGRIGTDGRLRDICVGTGQSDNRQYYLDRPAVTGDLHGQAPLLWFIEELWAGSPRRY